MEDQNFLLQEEKSFRQQYRLSLWLVEHRAFLKRLGLSVLATFDSILLLFVFWTMIDSFAIAYADEQQAVAEMVAYGQGDLHGYTKAASASPLVPSEARLFPLGNERYDFYVSLANENTAWWAEFDYRFTFPAGETPVLSSFILPGQKKPVVALAVDVQSPIQTVVFELVNARWHHVDARVIDDYPQWEQEHLAFEITDTSFSQEAGFDNQRFGETTFTVLNRTAYSYLDPVFYVLLKRGSSVVGVSRVVLSELSAGEQKNVTLHWFGTLPSVSTIEVIPDIHLFDPRVYREPKGKPSIDTRTRF